MTTQPVLYNVPEWIEANKKQFVPPVCVKLMHNEGQMKMFFVGGPNQRKDYHIECGEELFYQLKGDMVLKVVEQGKHRDIPIREGEMFLLPSHIAHSPQRYENTVGMVIERDRALNELDGLRYFVEKDGQPTLQSLFEEWLHCVDLGSQIAPVIKKFFASEQCRTGKPIPGTIPENPPVQLDMETKLEEPFVFKDWLKQHWEEIHSRGQKQIFGKGRQFQVFVYGKGDNSDMCDHAETIIWQQEGESKVMIQDKEYNLNKDDSMLVPKGERFTVTQDGDSVALVCYQDPSKSATWRP